MQEVSEERTVWKFGLVTDRPTPPPPTCTVMMPEGRQDTPRGANRWIPFPLGGGESER